MKTLFASSALALAATGALAQDVSHSLPESVARAAPALQANATDDLIGSVWAGEELSVRDRVLVTFSALMNRHEADSLGTFTELALDGGVTPA